tara:strand:+ start:1440 stop:1922 length:483 start_codon:yes stop_codon:yes gene_type:complete
MTEIIIEIECDGESYVENPKFDPEPTWIAEIENEVINERIRVEDTSYTRSENGCLISHWGYDKETGCKKINEISMNIEQAIFISNAIQKMFYEEKLMIDGKSLIQRLATAISTAPTGETYEDCRNNEAKAVLKEIATYFREAGGPGSIEFEWADLFESKI